NREFPRRGDHRRPGRPDVPVLRHRLLRDAAGGGAECLACGTAPARVEVGSLSPEGRGLGGGGSDISQSHCRDPLIPPSPLRGEGVKRPASLTSGRYRVMSDRAALQIREATAADIPGVLALYAQPELDDGKVLPVEDAVVLHQRFARYPDYTLYVALEG